MIKEFKFFEENGDEDMKIYWRMKLPLMSERDNVAHMKIQHLDGDKIFFKMTSIDHPDYPVDNKIVRMYQNITGY
jgi:hypothetical protein